MGRALLDVRALLLTAPSDLSSRLLRFKGHCQNLQEVLIKLQIPSQKVPHSLNPLPCLYLLPVALFVLHHVPHWWGTVQNHVPGISNQQTAEAPSTATWPENMLLANTFPCAMVETATERRNSPQSCQCSSDQMQTWVYLSRWKHQPGKQRKLEKPSLRWGDLLHGRSGKEDAQRWPHWSLQLPEGRL